MQDLSNKSNASTPNTQTVSKPLSASQKTCLFTPELLAASGRLKFTLTNDYLFRTVFQESPKALKGLLSSLLHIPLKEIFSVVITNPILPGAALGNKEIRLDINLILNNKRIIDLEMQVEYHLDWHDRSLIYLCRDTDHLAVGQKYLFLKPVMHIGILDSAPADEGNEFYSRNMLMNVKTGKIYNDKLVLCMLNLKQIKNATDEDRLWGIDRWARLFRAETWEEIKMIAENDEYMAEAANTLFRLSGDYMTRKIAQEREDYYREQRTWKHRLAQQQAALQKKDTVIAEKDAVLIEQQDVISQQQSALQEKNTVIAEKDTALAEKDTALAEQAALIAELKAQLAAAQSDK